MSDKSIEIKVETTDNSPEVLAALKNAVGRALWAMGAVAEGYAKQNAPVDTGRLRNSITHKETEDTTVIGSNVEYAAAQELGTSRGVRAKHYLKNAVTNHSQEYKNIIHESLKNA
jgi:HK97 gp10 family phage protein